MPKAAWLVTPTRTWLRVGVATGFVLGLVITLARDVLLPPHFQFDSMRIQAIALGLLSSDEDRTFQWVAYVYRALGVQNAPVVVAIVSFALSTAAILLAIRRSGRRVAAPLQAAIVVVAFVLSAVYLSDYSKDIFVLVPVIVLLVIPSRWWGDLIFIVVVLAYAATLRQYWAIVIVAYVVYRLLTRIRIDSRRLVIAGILGACAFGLALFLVTGAQPDMYRVMVNTVRPIVANSQINELVLLPQPFGGLINIALTYVFLVVPLPLLFTAGPQYLPVVLLFALIWLPAIWMMRGTAPSPRVRSVLFSRSVSLVFAFLLTQALFEPDYGSALRHLTPLMPLVIVIYFGLMKRGVEEAPRAAIDPTSALLVIHWGQNGGGPRFAVRMAAHVRAAWSGAVYTSFNRNAEIVAEGAEHNDFAVTTYRSAAGVVLGLPRLVVTSIRLARFIRRHRIRVVYSPMLSVWQSVFTYFFLPRDVVFVASIHDATEHPGDANAVLRWCRRRDLRRADVIVAYSESSAESLRAQARLLETPVIVVPHAADASAGAPRTALPHQGRPLVLGFVGRLVEYKGIDLFVDAVRLLSSTTDARGLVIGDGTVDPALVKSSGAAVEWRIGWIPESQLAGVFDEIDILVLPYREASQSGVLTLALSAGVPVVATPVGGLREQVESTGAGVLAEGVTAEALVAAISQVAKPRAYAQFSAKATSAADGPLSWARAADILVAELVAPQPEIERLPALAESR